MPGTSCIRSAMLSADSTSLSQIGAAHVVLNGRGAEAAAADARDIFDADLQVRQVGQPVAGHAA